MFSKFVDKLFKDKDGHVAVLQVPNIPLAVWIVATLCVHVLPPGHMRTASGYIALGAIVIWAALEIYSGSSLFRRIIGGVVLLLVVYNRL